MVYHVKKNPNIQVKLQTTATREMLEKEKYDDILVAIGSEPIVPPIPGVTGNNVFFVWDVFGKEDALAEEIAVIGGGEIGVETGIHLAQKGHKVTVLEMRE